VALWGLTESLAATVRAAQAGARTAAFVCAPAASAAAACSHCRSQHQGSDATGSRRWWTGSRAELVLRTFSPTMAKSLSCQNIGGVRSRSYEDDTRWLRRQSTDESKQTGQLLEVLTDGLIKGRTRAAGEA
jgi:hypothetical protein